MDIVIAIATCGILYVPLSSQEYELKERESIPFSVGQVGFSFPLSLFAYAQFLQVCDFAQTISYYVLH